MNNIRNIHISESDLSRDQLIDIRKRIASTKKSAKETAKHSCCLLCGKKVNGFCNSHTIPQMSLSVIAENGKLNDIYSFANSIVLEQNPGIKNAGTFFNICNDCDNNCFKIYENPQSYISDPALDHELLAQIALKNILRDIYKHEVELEMYKLMQDQDMTPFAPFLYQHLIKMRQIDVQECYSELKNCQSYSGNNIPWANVIISERLDYTAPIAYQGMISITTGFDKEVINNKFTNDANYHLEYLHLAVLPIETQTIILLFLDKGNKRYDKFIRRVQKLPKTKKLHLISYLILLYCEDYFYSKQLPPRTINRIKGIASSLEDYSSTNPKKSLEQAIIDYDLSKAWKTPNLLGYHVK